MFASLLILVLNDFCPINKAYACNIPLPCNVYFDTPRILFISGLPYTLATVTNSMVTFAIIKLSK